MSSAAASEPEHSETVRASARVAQLFERHGRMVFGICRAILRDAHDAEDATQQTFLSAHRALLGGAQVRDSGAWIATIARNECRRRVSEGMRHPLPVAGDDLADLPRGTDELEQRLQQNELVDALAGLPSRQREAVILRYVYGFRYGEVSKALGLSRPATEALLFRARRTMRLRLRPAAGVAIAVPVAVRTGLASALPGFEPDVGAGTGAGVIGGLVAKLAATPMLAKIGTVSIAATAVGAAGVVQSNGTSRAQSAPAPETRSVESVRRGAGDAIGANQAVALRRSDVGSTRRVSRDPHPGVLRLRFGSRSAAPHPRAASGESGDAAGTAPPGPSSGLAGASSESEDTSQRALEQEPEATRAPVHVDKVSADDLSEPPRTGSSGPDDASLDSSGPSPGSSEPDATSSGSNDSSSSGDAGSGDSGASGLDGGSADDGT